MNMTPTERLYRIVEQGLCTGCGLCQAVAGEDRVKVTKVTSGYERPVVVGEIDDALVDKIYDVCPGVHAEGLPEAEIGTETRIDNVWGPWRRMVHAYAGDSQVRHLGATGGVLTALGIYLLESGRARFILHAKASTSEPTFGEKHLSFTADDVRTGAGSRYGPTAPLIDVGEALDRNEPFAFVGKPCDIAALRNLGRHDPRVDELVKYWLTPVCGGYMPPQGMQAFLERNGIDPDAVTGFSYRGNGCPGPTRVETADGATDFHYLDLWGEDESMWVLPWRCKICPDGIGEAADIAAADTWPGGSPDRETSDSDPGTNAVIARTARGVELLEAAAADGALAIENDLVPDELSAYQPHQMRKKYAVGARYLGLADEGYLYPETRRLRVEELSSEMPEHENAQQREGARARVHVGKANEPTPKPAP